MARYVTQVAKTIVAVFGYAVDTIVVVLCGAVAKRALCTQAILITRSSAALRAGNPRAALQSEHCHAGWRVTWPEAASGFAAHDGRF